MGGTLAGLCQRLDEFPLINSIRIFGEPAEHRAQRVFELTGREFSVPYRFWGGHGGNATQWANEVRTLSAAIQSRSWRPLAYSLSFCLHVIHPFLRA